jgi:methionine-rich copper-binding protein CopC
MPGDLCQRLQAHNNYGGPKRDSTAIREKGNHYVKKLIGLFSATTAALALGAFLLTGIASAHAPYASSTPAAGAVLSASPASVVINFQANIQRTAGSFGATVTKDGAGSVTSGAATVSTDAQLTVPLQANLAAGRYVVNWNNAAADDGDTLSGAFSFYINVQPTTAQLAQDQALAAVEAGQLATATAETIAQATQTAQAAAPALATTAAAAPTQAKPALIQPAPSASAALPRTGNGPSGASNHQWAFGLLAVAGLALSLTSFAYYRTRAR